MNRVCNQLALKSIGIVALCAFAVCGPTAFAGEPESPIGFSEDAGQQQLALEDDYKSRLNAKDLDQWMQELARHPHHAGSPHSRANVEMLVKLFREWGYTTEVASYEVLLPKPIDRIVELIEPEYYSAGLQEDIVEGDESSSQRADVLPPFNAFSIDGDVTAELVYVNYGIPEDYELLERYGIDVKGKIAIARYGKSWRGIKPKLAAEHGAIGALIYSDPADDGYAAGDVYPEGPFKNDSGVQRGSVVDMPTYPGDVLTPGRGATKNAKRLKRKDAVTITRIPVLPISYRDALPLLGALGGEVVPAEWRGALPITYHMGPGPAKVRLKASFEWEMITIENVIARMQGTTYPDQWIIRGNHHDGWNHGAGDPISGLVAMMAEAKAIGELAAEGKPPMRSIVFAAWDAEEPGLIGSTEWVEDNATVLKDKAVAYLNTDGSGRGFVFMGGSHTLEHLFNQVARTVIDPQTSVSVSDRYRASVNVNGTQAQKNELKASKDLRISPLGSGSDYTPFLQHLGIASGNIAFGGESGHGSYHTLYDTYEHFSRFRDPGMAYGVALADVTGRVTLRLANAAVLPFRFTNLADNLKTYVEEIENLADTQRSDAVSDAKLKKDKAFDLALDPTRPLTAPQNLTAVPYFNFAPLKNAIVRLETAASDLDEKLADVAQDGEASEALNRKLYLSERQLTSPAGLPQREWYRHQVYAPGFYTGYGVKTLPRVREAIEAKDYAGVDDQIQITAQVLEAFADYLNGISRSD
ncbi:MAG: M28 family peptidase [Proteobacteria bacterium]|nr:M28 family peptidase [Pseudomonadota bacterium]